MLTFETFNYSEPLFLLKINVQGKSAVKARQTIAQVFNNLKDKNMQVAVLPTTDQVTDMTCIYNPLNVKMDSKSLLKDADLEKD